MRDDHEQFSAAGTLVYSVNPRAHGKQVDKNASNLRLLSDPCWSVAGRHGALKANRKGIERTF